MKNRIGLIIVFITTIVTGCHSRCEEHINVVTGTADTSTHFTGFNFFVLGDWGRRGSACQQAVAGQMIAYASKRHPAFIITTGDNFYEEGVQSVYDSHWTESFSNVYKELTKNYNWYPVLGNHDYEGDAWPWAEFTFHRINPRWNMPWFYSTRVAQTPDHEAVRFVFIDTNPFYIYYYFSGENRFVASQDTAKQRQWIDSILANATEPWKIVVGHHPVFSCGTDHGNTRELIELLKPLLEKYKVQAYISGHDHNLQHQRPAGSYVDYFVCGAGAEVNDVNQTAETKFAESIPGFADIAISHDTLRLQYIDYNGKVVYSYVRKR